MTAVRDIIIISVVLFVIGIISFIFVGLSHSINNQLLLTPSINSSSHAVAVINSSDTASNMMDYIYLAMFIGLFLSIIIAGWFASSYPVFIPIYFILIILFTFVSVVLQLIWIDITATSYVSSTLTYLPITNYILSHLGYFIAVMGLVGILVMYAKPDNNGGSY